MKMPADALVEWRCTCGKLYGFVRKRSGRYVFTAGRRTPNFVAYRPTETEDREFRVTADEPFPEGFTQASPGTAFLEVWCGRHLGHIPTDGWQPQGVHRRKVMIPPRQSVKNTRSQNVVLPENPTEGEQSGHPSNPRWGPQSAQDRMVIREW